MFIKPFYFLVKQLCKLIGLSFSFSSDGEDVILMKYLCRIKNGNYIDIGSHQPVKHSNTFLFYLTGWKGVCIDPLPNLKSKYRFIRRRDKFINAGIPGLDSRMLSVKAARNSRITKKMWNLLFVVPIPCIQSFEVID